MIKKIKEILEPLGIIKSEKNYFWVWFAFTVFAGQLGIIANIILKGSFKKYSIFESIVQDSPLRKVSRL